MDSLSEDALSIICGWLSRNELLVVRALSRAGRGAVQLAVRSHSECRACSLSELGTGTDKSGMSVGKAAALGRVFGGGCRRLHIFLWKKEGDTSEDTKTMLLEATRAFHETIAPPGLGGAPYQSRHAGKDASRDLWREPADGRAIYQLQRSPPARRPGQRRPGMPVADNSRFVNWRAL